MRFHGVNDTREDVSLQLEIAGIGRDMAADRLAVLDAIVPAGKSVPLEFTRRGTETTVLAWSWKASNGMSGEDHFSPVPYKRLDLRDPAITVSASQTGESLEIALTCEKPAFFVALESRTPGRFDDNWISLLPGRERLVRFTPHEQNRTVPAHIAVRDLFTATCRPG